MGESDEQPRSGGPANSDGTDPGDDAASRILLLLGEGRNRRLLVEWAEEADYRTTVLDPEDPGDPAEAESFDLCILDVAGARGAGDYVAAIRRQSHPAFFPALLVVPERAEGRVGADTGAIDGVELTVDDVVATPVRKRELGRRVETLLRARTLSVELEERKEQYRQLLGLTPEAIFLLREGSIVFLNEVARELLAGVEEGAPASEFEGRSFESLVAAGDRDAAVELLANIEEGQVPEEFVELTLVDGEGGTVETEVTGIRVPFENGLATQLVVRDVSDRKRRERRLRLYGRALEEASVGITIADVTQPDDPLVYANESFERVTGYPVPRILGRNCRFLQGEGTDPEAVARIREILAAEESGTVTIKNYREDGTPFWNELELAPVPAPDGEVTHYLGFQRDVTDRVERERQLEALHESARELMGAETKREIAETAVATAGGALDLPGVAVYLYDDIEGGLRPVAAADRTYDLFGELPTLRPGESVAWEVYESGETRSFDDVREHPSVYDPETPARSELIVPLSGHGVFIAGATETDAFDDGDERFARLLALNVEAALDRADREQQLRERTRELETRVRQQEVVADLGRRAIGSSDLDSLFESAVAAVAETLGTEFCKVLEYRPEREDLLLRAGVGWDDGYVGASTAVADERSQGGYTLDSAEPVVVTDLATDDRFGTTDLLADHDVSSGISVAIGSTEDPWGVLGVHDVESQRFPPEDANFVQSVANVLASAIDRVEHERALAESEQRYRTLAEHFPNGAVGVYDRDLRYTLAEGVALGDTLPPADRLEGSRMPDVFPTDTVADIEPTFRAAVEAGESGSTTTEFGGRIWRVWGTPLRDTDGEVYAGLSFAQDITESTRRERELERYETVVRTAGEGIYTLDAEGYFVEVNRAMEELTGYDRETLVGEHVSTVLDGEDIDRAERLIADLLTGDNNDGTITMELVRADGQRRLINTNIALLPHEEEFRGTVGVVRDVTERHQRVQRMEVMDRILRHNLRNEMNVVRGRAEMLRKHADADGAEHLDEIVRSANALLSLSEGARRFHEAFQGDNEVLGSVELVGTVEGVVASHREQYPAATIRTDLPDEQYVECHQSLPIAIQELVENAIVHGEDGPPAVNVTVTAGDEWVELAVADDGPGLPPAERRTFHEETESALEHASGLGLWLVNWIVSSSGGEVVAEDDDPQGTVVRVRLRPAESPA